MTIEMKSTAMRRWATLAASLLIVGFVWLAVLPLLATQPVIAEHIALQKRLGIDPSAMFYSELEIVSAIAHRVERLNENQSAKFWGVSKVDSTIESPDPELKLTQ